MRGAASMDPTLDTAEKHRPDSYEQLTNRYELLLGQHQIELRLADRLGSGCEFPEMFAAIAESSDLPMWVFDTRGPVVLRSGDRELDQPDIASICADARAGQLGNRFVIAPAPNGVARRFLVRRLEGSSADDSIGWLVMGEIGRSFRKLDQFLVDRGAVYLARHCTLHHAMHRSIADLTQGLWNGYSGVASTAKALSRMRAELVSLLTVPALSLRSTIQHCRVASVTSTR